MIVVGNGRTYTALSDSQGAFAVELPVGNYQVRSCGSRPVPTKVMRGRVSHVDVPCDIS